MFSGILAVSASIFSFLIWLIYFKESSADVVGSYRSLPAFNAMFNALSGGCLVAGYRAIRRGDRKVHKRFMLAALTFSLLFFVGYVVYHNVHGDTKFTGAGFIRPVYFTILISHIVLTMFCLPAILATVAFAATARFDRHKKIARYTLPIWLYVSVSGVAIFLMLNFFG